MILKRHSNICTYRSRAARASVWCFVRLMEIIMIVTARIGWSRRPPKVVQTPTYSLNGSRDKAMACSQWHAAKDTGRETSLCEYCLQMSMDYICVSSNLLFVTDGSRTGSTRGADRHLNGVPGVSGETTQHHTFNDVLHLHNFLNCIFVVTEVLIRWVCLHNQTRKPATLLPGITIAWHQRLERSHVATGKSLSCTQKVTIFNVHKKYFNSHSENRKLLFSIYAKRAFKSHILPDMYKPGWSRHTGKKGHLKWYISSRHQTAWV